MGLRMESCRPWWCCRGSAPPPPGTGTALGPGGWPRLCRDGSPGGGGGLSSSAGLDDEWSGVPDGVFSSSELPSTDLPLPFSDAASGLWLLALEFSLFSLQEQEQSSGVSGETEAARRSVGSQSRRAQPAGAFGFYRFLLQVWALVRLVSPDPVSLYFLPVARLPTSPALTLRDTFLLSQYLPSLPAPTEWLTFLFQSTGAEEQGSWNCRGEGQRRREGAWIFRSLLAENKARVCCGELGPGESGTLASRLRVHLT